MAYRYANLDDQKLHNDFRILVQLTNDDDGVDPSDATQIDESVLEAAENDAAITVDNFLRNIYEVPLSGDTLTPEIVRLTAKLTWCNLWERRGDETQQVTRLRQDIRARLKAMGAPSSEENRDQDREGVSQPVRFKGGKTRTIFDDAGYFDGLPSLGTYVPPAQQK